MPRPNRSRTLGSEVSLARRIEWEREQRGWTYEGLASRMARHGCAIQPSALYKIEKVKPPRRITVDELVGLSRAFDIPVDDLLRPVEYVLNRDLSTQAEAELDAAQAIADATTEFADARRRLRAMQHRAQIGGEHALTAAMAVWQATTAKELAAASPVRPVDWPAEVQRAWAGLIVAVDAWVTDEVWGEDPDKPALTWAEKDAD